MAQDPDVSRLESVVAPGSPDSPNLRLSRPLSYESKVASTRPSRWVHLASTVCLVLLMTLAGGSLVWAIFVIIMFWGYD